MLSYLRIRGLALLDDVSLELGPGLNVLTGETGAGKSMIIDALSLLRGVRARADAVREGDDAAMVDAQFELGPDATASIELVLADHLAESPEANPLVLQRVVPRAGRGRSFVQSNLTTQGVLAKVGEQLVDICSQHEHHSLTRVSRHGVLLDAFAGLEDDVRAYQAQYRTLREAQAARDELDAGMADALQRADYLRFQLEEIDRIAPEPGEYETLKQRVSLLREAHEWVDFARRAQDVLYESDDAIAGRLANLLDQATKGAEGSRSLADLQEQLAAAHVACEEAAQLATQLSRELDFEPGELEMAEERLHDLDALRRKHGVEAEALPARIEAMREELEAAEHVEERRAALEDRVRELEAACRESAAALSRKRTRGARTLAQRAGEELAALHLPDARLEVQVTQEEDLGSRGLDAVEILFCANAGEAMAPLNRVASGGELSRVLLAIKGALSTGDHVETYVFDEVDAGVGGAVAQAIGERLYRASRDHQVLCITHLPQIAAFADEHFLVSKHGKRGRTVTRVAQLDAEARIDEIARMLGGSDVGASAREHAAALVEGAGRSKVEKPAAKKARAASKKKTTRSGKGGRRPQAR